MSSICLSMEQGFSLRGYMDRGVSNDAYELKKITSDIANELTQNVISEPIRDVLEALQEVHKECSTNNWDGYGSLPIKEGSYYEAKRFIKSLPFVSFPFPEVSIDPDGEIVFEWNNGPRRIFSISVGNTGTLTYAGIFGGNNMHGIEDFEDAIPKAILENIKRVFS